MTRSGEAEVPLDSCASRGPVPNTRTKARIATSAAANTLPLGIAPFFTRSLDQLRASRRDGLLALLELVLMVMGEAARCTASLQKLGEGDQCVKIARPQSLDELAKMLARRLGVASPPSARGRLRPLGIGRRSGAVGEGFAIGRRRLRPLWTRQCVDGVRTEPRFHERPQSLAPESEPFLALGPVRHKHVFEAPERAF